MRGSEFTRWAEVHEGKTIIHVDGQGGDYTLCGAAPEEGYNGEPMERRVRGRITCTTCISIIRYSKTIPASMIARSPNGA